MLEELEGRFPEATRETEARRKAMRKKLMDLFEK